MVCPLLRQIGRMLMRNHIFRNWKNIIVMYMPENISVFSSASSVVRVQSKEWIDFLLINGVFTIPGGGTSTSLFKLCANGIVLNSSDKYELFAILYSRKQVDGSVSPICFSRSNHGMTTDMPDMEYYNGLYFAQISGMTGDLIIVEASNTDTIGFSIRRAVPRQM